MEDINEKDLARLLVILLRFRMQVLEQAREAESYVRGVGRTCEKIADADMNTKEIAYMEYLCYECAQLN